MTERTGQHGGTEKRSVVTRVLRYAASPCDPVFSDLSAIGNNAFIVLLTAATKDAKPREN